MCALLALFLWSTSLKTNAPTTRVASAPSVGGEATLRNNDALIQPQSNAIPKLSATRRNQPTPNVTPPLPAPLPATGTKVAKVLDDLKMPADHGDSRAACRLGVELARCFRVKQLVGMSTSLNQHISQEQDPARKAMLLGGAGELDAEIASESNACEGVSSADYNEAWSYLVQSANEGNAEAAAFFYMAPPVSDLADTSELQDVWREHREEYRDMAIRAGNPYALNAAAVLESLGIGPPGARIEYGANYYNALKYSIASVPLDGRLQHDDVQKYFDRLRAKLSPQQAADAEREGNALREAYFRDTNPVTDIQKSGDPRPERCGTP